MFKTTTKNYSDLKKYEQFYSKIFGPKITCSILHSKNKTGKQNKY